MPLMSLNLRRIQISSPWVCSKCFRKRLFSTSVYFQSGHSKWTTIKHDKGKNDAAKNKQRSVFSHEISNASKLFGSDPNTNTRLALAISNAKKAGIPKTLIENAIARGQGISASGAALESVTVEAILPFSIATVIDCQTDNKLRTLADLRLLIKQYDGTVTPTSYLFEKKGRIIFRQKPNFGIDDVLEKALEASALDIQEDKEGRIFVYTKTNETKSTAESLSHALSLEIQESEIIWDPIDDTKIRIDSEDVLIIFGEFLDKLRDISGVQGVYMNASQGNMPDVPWSEFESKFII